MKATDVRVAIAGIMLMFGDTNIDRQKGIKRCREAMDALDEYETAVADEMRVQGELATLNDANGA